MAVMATTSLIAKLFPLLLALLAGCATPPSVDDEVRRQYQVDQTN
jgi:hypothetical protein